MSARHRLLWLPLLVVLAGAAAIFARSRLRGGGSPPETPSLAVLGDLPDFSLVERSGRSVARADLLGRVWIADFIFTRCGGPCPLLTMEMARLAKALPSEVRFVSVSVDPAHDTPEILASYAETYGADRERWFFLTGEKSAVYSLVGDGFHVTAKEEAGADPASAVTHSLRFALVDRRGRIRGYYQGYEREELRRLREDVARVLAE